MAKEFGLVAVPRRFITDAVLALIVSIFGTTLPTKQPLRWLLFRELSAREQMERSR